MYTNYVMGKILIYKKNVLWNTYFIEKTGATTRSFFYNMYIIS